MNRFNSMVIIFFILPFVLSAQSISFPDDTKERGYYNRPYKRYEAEPGKCITNGLFLPPTYVQSELQSEASNQIATQLTEPSSYVGWTNEEEADGMVIRFSIPDSEDGSGTNGLLSLFVNDKYVQDITLDSYWAWQYALMTGQTYPDNQPGDNKFARMRFDEVRVKLETKIPAGAIFKLIKTDETTAPYTIDFVELEAVPELLTFESITDANKIRYTPADGPLDIFISMNGGKFISLKEGAR